MLLLRPCHIIRTCHVHAFTSDLDMIDTRFELNSSDIYEDSCIYNTRGGKMAMSPKGVVCVLQSEVHLNLFLFYAVVQFIKVNIMLYK